VTLGEEEKDELAESRRKARNNLSKEIF